MKKAKDLVYTRNKIMKCEICKKENKKVLPLYFDGIKKYSCCYCAIEKLNQGYKVTYDLFLYQSFKTFEKASSNDK